MGHFLFDLIITEIWETVERQIYIPILGEHFRLVLWAGIVSWFREYVLVNANH